MKRKVVGLILIVCLLCLTAYGAVNKSAMRKHAVLFPGDGYYALDGVSYGGEANYDPPLAGPLAAFNVHPRLPSAQISFEQPFVHLGGNFGTEYPALVLWFSQVEPLGTALQQNVSSPDDWTPNSLPGPSLWVKVEDEDGNHTEEMVRLVSPINKTGYGQARPLTIHSFPRSGNRLTATLYGRNRATDQPVLLGAVHFQNPDVHAASNDAPQKLPATQVDDGGLPATTVDGVRVQLTQCRSVSQTEWGHLPEAFKAQTESLRLPSTRPVPPAVAAHFQVVGAQPGQWSVRTFSISDSSGNESDALGTEASFCRGLEAYAAAPLSRPLRVCRLQAELIRNDPAIKIVTINVDPKAALHARSVVKTILMRYTEADGKPRVVKTILSLTEGSDEKLHAEYAVKNWTPHVYPALEVDPAAGWVESAGGNTEGVMQFSLPDAPAGHKTIPIKMTIRNVADVSFECLPR